MPVLSTIRPSTDDLLSTFSLGVARPWVNDPIAGSQQLHYYIYKHELST